jgi:hypothetical protein
MLCLFFFGPLIREELLVRFPLSVARAAAAEGRGDEVSSSRLSYAQMADIVRISLPPEMTIPIQRADRTKTGKLDFLPHPKTFSRLNATLTGDTTPDGLRLRRAVEEEDHAALWQILFARPFGVNYPAAPTYRRIIANMVTISAGIELFLFHHWNDDGLALLRDAPRVWSSLDCHTLQSIAARTGVSSGVVLAAVVQMAGAKTSSRVRAGLEKGDWEPLNEALWGPLLPEFRRHPFYKTFQEKLQNPGLRAKTGRPEDVPLTPPGGEVPLPAVLAAKATEPLVYLQVTRPAPAAEKEKEVPPAEQGSPPPAVRKPKTRFAPAVRHFEIADAPDGGTGTASNTPQ